MSCSLGGAAGLAAWAAPLARVQAAAARARGSTHESHLRVVVEGADRRLPPSFPSCPETFRGASEAHRVAGVRDTPVASLAIERERTARQ